MEFEALLFGVEPVTALALGVAAVILTPVLKEIGSAIGSAMKSSELGKSVSESAKDIAKESLVLGMGAIDNLQFAYSQGQETVRDVVVDATLEYTVNQAVSKIVEEPQKAKKITSKVIDICKNIWARIRQATSAVSQFFERSKS
jgi:hypothetical protein